MPAPKLDLEEYESLQKESLAGRCLISDSIIEKWLKSADESRKYRLDGNKIYKKTKDCMEALCSYNKAVIKAPFPKNGSSDSTELSLAFGNRSAMLFELGNYKKCLLNISWALQFGFPKSKSSKLFERQAKCYLKLGYPKDAVEAYQQVVENGKELGASQEQIDSITEAMNALSVDDANETPLDLSDPDPWTELPELSSGPNPSIPSASSCISLFYDEKKGVGFKAERDIRVGEVLIVEPAYTFTLDRCNLIGFCFQCMKRVSDPYPCQQCCFVHYCSEECANLSWSISHRFECLILCHLNGIKECKDKEILFKMCVLSVRMILCAGPATLLSMFSQQSTTKTDRLQSLHNSGVLHSHSFEAIAKLVSHIDKTTSEQLISNKEWAFLSVRLLKTVGFFDHCFKSSAVNLSSEMQHEFEWFIWWSLLNGYLITFANGFAIYYSVYKGKKNRFGSLGSAIYLASSLLNHSCNPNTGRKEYGTAIVIRARTGIKKGDELTINYTCSYLDMPKAERQKICREYFKFTCECKACLGDWLMPSDTDRSETKFGCVSCNFPTVTKCDTCSKPVSELISQYNMEVKHLNKFEEEEFAAKGYPMDKVVPLLKMAYSVFEVAAQCVFKPSHTIHQTIVDFIDRLEGRLAHAYSE